jgi:4-oxalocrotonate tautomerase
MPLITVEMFPGRTRDQKKQFAETVTRAFVETCGGTPESVQIIFRHVEREDWAVAGRLASEPKATKPADATQKSA